MELQYRKLNDAAVLMPHAHATDAGLDLCTASEVVLIPGVPVKVGTGISMAIPEGYVGLIWDKSSIGSLGVKVLGGVIDAGYRGEVIVCLINLTSEAITFPTGKKIAQIIIQNYAPVTPILALDHDRTTRGEEGFGSTGE